MAHKTHEELKEIIENAKDRVLVGGKYFHYKNPDNFYTIVDIVIIEATEEAGVIYRAEYEELQGISFMRSLSDFLGEVDVDGNVLDRFTLVE